MTYVSALLYNASGYQRHDSTSEITLLASKNPGIGPLQHIQDTAIGYLLAGTTAPT